MIKVVVCIGSACHLKGSQKIVEGLQYLIKRDALEDKIELSGTFCNDDCTSDGVSVTVDGKGYFVKPEELEKFYDANIKL